MRYPGLFMFHALRDQTSMRIARTLSSSSVLPILGSSCKRATTRDCPYNILVFGSPGPWFILQKGNHKGLPLQYPRLRFSRSLVHPAKGQPQGIAPTLSPFTILPLYRTADPSAIPSAGATKTNLPSLFSAIRIIPCDSIPLRFLGARFTRMETR
jgi:hypothetical protein